MKSKYTLLILALILVISPCKKAKAQAEYIIPTTLISYGVLAQFVPALDDFDLSIREGFSSFNQNKCKIDDYIQYLPTFAFAGLGTLGVETDYKFVDRLCIGAAAYTLVGATVLTTKQLTGIERPDGSANNSFPSGHTAFSFVGADLVYMAYKDTSPIYGIAAYACATTVGFLRMYNNRHWFSDVVCGAGVGILASRLSFWAFDKIKQCLNKRNNKDLSFNGDIAPFVYDNKIGLSLSLNF